MDKRILDRDPLTGAVEIFHYDHTNDTYTIQTVNDVSPVLERNKALYNDGTNGWSKSREMKRIASIPMEVIMLWKTQYGIDIFDRNHDEGIRRLLDSSEWRYLRTAPGSL